MHGPAGVHLKHLLPRVDFRVETVTVHPREILELHNFCCLKSSRIDMGGEDGGKVKAISRVDITELSAAFTLYFNMFPEGFVTTFIMGTIWH